MDTSIAPHFLDKLCIHGQSGLSGFLLLGPVVCQPLLVLLLENFGLLNSILPLTLGILVALLHLHVEGVQHVLDLAVSVGFSPRGILLGISICILLDLLDLGLEVGFQLRVATGDVGTHRLAIPFYLIHSRLDCCSISCFSIISGLLASHGEGLVFILTGLLSSGCLFHGLVHLILGLLALAGILFRVGLSLLTLTFVFITHPLQHAVLLSLPPLLIGLPALPKAFKALLVDGFGLIPDGIMMRLLCLCDALILFDLVQHILALLLSRTFFVVLQLPELLHLRVQHVLKLFHLCMLACLDVRLILFPELVGVKRHDQVPMVHGLQLGRQRHGMLWIHLHATPLAHGILIWEDGGGVWGRAPNLFWIGRHLRRCFYCWSCPPKLGGRGTALAT
mmetsp:Transcript_57500/g.134675  ORF Transcript_57500/g.134675 Transcript_57500/m.134675 type:complete len:392 (+) Transcript_57500:324-1499(+)